MHFACKNSTYFLATFTRAMVSTIHCVTNVLKCSFVTQEVIFGYCIKKVSSYESIVKELILKLGHITYL